MYVPFLLFSQADSKIINDFNCTLPWIVDKIYEPCSIIDEHRNESYANIVLTWSHAFDNFNQKFVCPVVPKCKRTIYQMVVSTKSVSYSAKGL